jgi:curved DNA-binding protein CbpA
VTKKRRFRRYRKDSDFILRHKGKSYSAKLVDYSLEGIGLELKEQCDIKKGEVITITGRSPDLKTVSQVVWSNREGSACKIGVRNTGQLTGCIEDFKLADTLYGLKMGEKTGILDFQTGTVLRTIYLKKGDIIFSASNLDSEHLGERLVKEGKITLEQLQDIVKEMKDTDQRMGRVLVSRRILKPNDIWRMVRKQAEEIILNLFPLEEGVFTFKEMASLPNEEYITLRLSLANIIYHGMKKISNMLRIRGELPDHDIIVDLSSEPLNLFQNVRIDEAGQKVISCLGAQSTIKDIKALTGLDGNEVLKTVFALLSTRIIEIKPPDRPDADLSKEEIDEILKEKTEPKIMEIIEDMYKNHESLGYYGVLGIKEDTTPLELKKAYYRAAKQFHPDMHFFLEDETLKYKLSHIFSYISKAYRTLSDRTKRGNYSKHIKQKPSGPASKQNMARKSFSSGLSLFRKGKHSEAESAFQQALNIDDSRAEYHYYYGLALLKQSKYSKAKKAVERAIQLDPLNAEYIAALGDVFLKMGATTRAKTLYKKASKLSADNRTRGEGLKKS